MKKYIKKIAHAILGIEKTSQMVSSAARIKTCFLRTMRFIRNGFRRNINPTNLKKYGDDDHQVFFGYYDFSPVNFDDTILLATRTSPANTPIEPGRSLEIGYYNLSGDPLEFIPIAETKTWCWQQGCRLQWYPLNLHGKNNLVIYNTLIDGNYGSCIQSIKTKKIVRSYRVPIYALSPDGVYSYTLNFSRLGRLRPGYGYVNLLDSTINQKAPDNDGIWRVDMETGEKDLLFSVADMAKFEPLESMKGAEHYFNFICINPSGTRCLFLHIWMNTGKRHTRLITCNMDGSEPYALINEGHASHYNCKSNDEILCFSTHANTGMRYHLYIDKTRKRKIVGEGLLNVDGHPSYSKDSQYLLTDTYPDKYSDRHLLLYDLKNNLSKVLGSFFSPLDYAGEMRCDLHPRWSPSGRIAIFDSSHEGKRNIYTMDLRDILRANFRKTL